MQKREQLNKKYLEGLKQKNRDITIRYNIELYNSNGSFNMSTSSPSDTLVQAWKDFTNWREDLGTDERLVLSRESYTFIKGKKRGYKTEEKVLKEVRG